MSVKIKNDEVAVFALGGLGEVGKNLYCVQYQDEIVVMDCGVLFPEDELLGVDYVIPDYTYLIKNKEKVKGVFISHGHEDHIGSIPYLLKEINVPIYAGRLTCELIRNKLREHGLLGQAVLHEIDEDVVIQLDKLSVTFARVTHSYPESFAVCVKTPYGYVIWTGDFKFDLTPVGEGVNFHKLSRLGEEGVLCLLSDSTNAEIPTFTKSEQSVGRSIRSIIRRAEGRVILASFASNISRLKQVIETAGVLGRKVVVFGRSMENGIKTGLELGFIEDKYNVLIDQSDIRYVPPEDLIVLCTGSQGEPMAALSRIANGTHRQIKIEEGDTVIFSSSPIPGNTLSVNRVINQLTEAGATIIAGREHGVHTSGHGGQIEQMLMIQLLQPKYFIPVHGEYRMLKIHCETAAKVNVPPEKSFALHNGEVVVMTDEYAKRAGSFPCPDVYVDGSGIGDVGSVVLRDRKTLSDNGLVIVTATVDYEEKQLISGPDIMSRGFIYMRESGEFINDMQHKLRSAINQCLNESGSYVDEKMIRDTIFETIKPLIYKETERKPLILPVVLDINKGARKKQLVNK